MIIKRLVACFVALTLVAIGSVAVAKNTKKPKKKSATSSFFVKMQVGDEATLATSGPLELYAVCSKLSGADIRVILYLTSSEADWRNSISSDDRPVGDLGVACVLTGDTPTFTDCSKSLVGVPFAAMSVSGDFLGFLQGATGVGVNVFGADCVVAGGVLKAKQ